MNISKYHNQKAYMYLRSEGSFVRAYVVMIKDGVEQTYVHHIPHVQAEYLVAHKGELELKGIHIIDNREVVATKQESVILALPTLHEVVTSVFSYVGIPTPYEFAFNEALFFSTQKTRGPNLK